MLHLSSVNAELGFRLQHCHILQLRLFTGWCLVKDFRRKHAPKKKTWLAVLNLSLRACTMWTHLTQTPWDTWVCLISERLVFSLHRRRMHTEPSRVNPFVKWKKESQFQFSFGTEHYSIALSNKFWIKKSKHMKVGNILLAHNNRPMVVLWWWTISGCTEPWPTTLLCPKKKDTGSQVIYSIKAVHTSLWPFFPHVTNWLGNTQ